MLLMSIQKRIIRNMVENSCEDPIQTDVTIYRRGASSLNAQSTTSAHPVRRDNPNTAVTMKRLQAGWCRSVIQLLERVRAGV